MYTFVSHYIQTRKQPADGKNIQLGQGIQSCGVLTSSNSRHFVTNARESPGVAKRREYILMHHAEQAE